MIKVVIFDLGGTLIEYAGPYGSWPALETPGFQAAYDALNQNGRLLPPFADFREAGFRRLPALWGAATRREQNFRVVDLLTAVWQDVGTAAVTAAELSAAAASYGRAIQAQAWLIDQAVETVQQVRAAGYRVGLVSNTMFPGSLHRADLERFGLLPYFEALLFSADINKWKPNAEPFLHVLDELQAGPDTAVYVGDDPASDVVGGQAAGLRTVYFKSNDRFHPLPGVQPHAEISHLAELLPLLRRWNGG